LTLRLRFSNPNTPDILEIAAEGFSFQCDTIVRQPSQEVVARYDKGLWCVGDRCFLTLVSTDRAVCDFRRNEELTKRTGPYHEITIVDGAIVGDLTPLATRNAGQGWNVLPGEEHVTEVRLVELDEVKSSDMKRPA
jgi:photosystem II stability/assembly factor-like uncharacterized protein